MEYYNQNEGKTVTEKVAVAVKAGTGLPEKRSAKTKIELCNDIGKSILFLMGKLQDTQT